MGGCSKEGDKYNRVGLMGFQYSKEPKFNVGHNVSLYQVLYKKSSDMGEPTGDLLNSHLEHLDKLSNAGQLESYGANLSGNGGFKMLVASSEKKAIEIASSDPLVENGYYAVASITPISSSVEEKTTMQNNNMISVK